MTLRFVTDKSDGAVLRTKPNLTECVNDLIEEERKGNGVRAWSIEDEEGRLIQ